MEDKSALNIPYGPYTQANPSEVIFQPRPGLGNPNRIQKIASPLTQILTRTSGFSNISSAMKTTSHTQHGRINRVLSLEITQEGEPWE